jgi:hemolysin III
MTTGTMLAFAVRMIRHRIAVTVEELANVATHGLGLVASLALLPLLVLLAARSGDAGVIVGVSIFAVTLVIAYAASTIYHMQPDGPRKVLWRSLDQSAVYLLIAGTYTPFALGALRGPLGWTLLGIIWGGAVVGIVAKSGLGLHAPRAENFIYLGMGWLVMIAFEPLLQSIGWRGLGWLVGGGIAYSVGTIFLSCQERVRFGHCAWHVFVLAGSACHIIAIANYGLVLPR